ncbi:hypothetical protein C8J57DRAFT_1508307 [Mycena rebaudengoi]|nr:hypothetical protein C8J57DRAFT_1508307 [Mycena rebaudengoi]
MDYSVNPAIYANYRENVLDEICTGSIGILSYGLFVPLFLFAIYLLYHRNTAGRRIFLALTISMGILSTTQFILRAITLALSLKLLQSAVKDGQNINPTTPSALEKLYWTLVFTEDAVLVINTILTDGLLMYRCYLVWGRPRRRFLLLPIMLVIATIGTGLITSYDQDATDRPAHIDDRIVFVLNLVTNFGLTGLTGTRSSGRIWWITRQQRIALGADFKPRYNSAIAIISESGAIYCAGLIFQLAALSVQSTFAPTVYLSHGVISQLVNIVPTLIIVRVGLGYNVHDTAPTTSVSQPSMKIMEPLRFNVRVGPESSTLDEVERADDSIC